MFIVSIILIIISVGCFVWFKKLDKVKHQEDFDQDSEFLASLIIGITVGCLGLILFIASFITIIDSGEIGVPILFGKVQDYTVKEGINLINPFASIRKYPIRLIEYTMSSAVGEGAQCGNDSIALKTKDGLTVGMDITLWWRPNKDKAFNIYREIAKDFDELIVKIVRPAMRTIVRDVAVQYTMNDLYKTSRQSFVSNLLKESKKYMEDKYIEVDKVLVRKIHLPEQVEKAIAQKMQIQQEAEAMEFQKQKSVKEAEIKKIEAKGLADAQRIINSSLTPLYVQFKAIDVYRELVNSKNTTFVVMPTSKNGAGMPLILNAK